MPLSEWVFQLNHFFLSTSNISRGSWLYPIFHAWIISSDRVRFLGNFSPRVILLIGVTFGKNLSLLHIFLWAWISRPSARLGRYLSWVLRQLSLRGFGVLLGILFFLGAWACGEGPTLIGLQNNKRFASQAIRQRKPFFLVLKESHFQFAPVFFQRNILPNKLDDIDTWFYVGNEGIRSGHA